MCDHHRVIAGLLFVTLTSGCTEPNDPLEGLRLEPLTSTSLTGVVASDIAPVPAVRALDRWRQPVPGIVVTFQVTGGGAIGVGWLRTDARGIASVGLWRLGRGAGRQTVIARSDGQDDIVFSVVAEPRPPSQVTRISGHNQTALTGEAVSDLLRVRVVDDLGNGVHDVPLTFTVISGQGSVDGASVVTDSSGYAHSGRWTLGAVPGAQEVRVGIDGAHTLFTAIACDEICQQLELVFERRGELFRTNLYSGQATALTASGGGRETHPAWSPDGRRLAFVRKDARFVPHLVLMDADGGNLRVRASNVHSPSWSPDGHRLAVARGDCVYECGIFVISVDGDSPVGTHVINGAEPAWSPDGTKIAFVGLSGDDGYHALYVANADGSSGVAIVPRGYWVILGPTWSPDGRRLAFTRCMTGPCDIFAVTVDGSDLLQVTTAGYTTESAFDPAWSPDGTRLAFSLGATPDRALVYVDMVRGGDPIPIIAAGSAPAWRPMRRQQQ